MKNTTKNTAYLWNVNYLFQFYVFWGVFFPFYPLWLKEANVDSKDIGIILACGLVSRCLAGIGITTLIKKLSHYIPVLRLFSFLSLIVALLMYLMHSNFFSLIIVYCLLNVIMAPLFGISEAIISFLDKRKVLDYGRTRLWGSIGFIFATIMCGYLFDIFSISILPLLLALIGVGLVVSSFVRCSALNTQLNRTISQQVDIEDKIPSSKVHIYLFFSIIILIQSSHAFVFGFASVYWEHLNISKTIIGYAWSAGVFGEVLIFIFARKLFANTSVVTLLVLSSLSVILRWTALAYAETPVAICAIQMLHGGTFAISQIALIKGIQLFIADLQLATFQGLVQGINVAVVASLTYLCGQYYDKYLGGLFLLMALIGVICLLLCLCFHKLFGSAVVKSQ